jgi:hypothetical protein
MRSSSASFARFALLVSLGFAGSLGACSAEDPDGEGPCRGADDCAVNELCVDGACTASSCEGDACPEGSGDDTDASADAGLGDDAGRDVGPIPDVAPGDATNDAADGSGTGLDVDGADATSDAADIDYGPLAWELVPADRATGVAQDVTIEVRFNQPMNALRFIPRNIELTPFDGEAIERSIAYDAETFTLLLGPTEEQPLLEALTPHTLRLDRLIQAASGETLGEPVFARFATGPAGDTEAYAVLARAYAPVVYQEVESGQLDTFTRVDFDDDFDMTNNEERALPAHPSFAYYDVIESRTHYFLTYAFYYPVSAPRDGLSYEHDFVFAQVVVQKLVDEPLGRLRTFRTVYHENAVAWALEDGFHAPGFVVSAGDSRIEGRLPAASVEDGRRIALFIEGGRHAVCLPNASTVLGPCAPATGDRAPFADGAAGLTLRVADAPDRWDGNGDATVNYLLLSFLETFWALRDRTDDADLLFSGEYLYRAPALPDDTRRPGNGRAFPATLLSDSVEGSFGELPFRLSASLDPDATGVWFVDPAWSLGNAYAFPESFSDTYCYNPYLSIDNRGQLDGCSP